MPGNSELPNMPVNQSRGVIATILSDVLIIDQDLGMFKTGANRDFSNDFHELEFQLQRYRRISINLGIVSS
jgi:hypothetical protein